VVLAGTSRSSKVLRTTPLAVLQRMRRSRRTWGLPCTVTVTA
jgi:hypothetical protein